MEQFFGGRPITLYASGTAALAQAVANCAARCGATAPEAIIPAYGCPDLVAACIHAGVYPRLVDVAAEQWSYQPDALRSALSSNTVAVIAVNLMGLGDGALQVASTCADKAIPVIQDSAQHLPRKAVAWPGDYVVLSFGRGKPLNLLGGGALVSPPTYNSRSSLPQGNPSGRTGLRTSRAAAIAFNVLTRPHVYRLVSALPGTAIGEVTYKPLREAAPESPDAWRRVGTAFELYRAKASYRRSIWAAALEEWSQLGILALHCPGTPPPEEPLRLTLLAPDRAARDSLVKKLADAGLGASRLYGAVMTSITGIPEIVKQQGPFPNSELLADRLFTLPTHPLVTRQRVDTVRAIVATSVRHGG